MNIYEILNKIKFNSKEEAQAIIGYTELLQAVEIADLTADAKSLIQEAIAEIIADEQNHEQRLIGLYAAISGISPKEE